MFYNSESNLSNDLELVWDCQGFKLFNNSGIKNSVLPLLVEVIRKCMKSKA